MSKKINFYLVYNDYGDTLPTKGTFYNDEKNEISRLQLRREYNTVSDYLAFKRFREDYYKFVKQMKEEAKTGTDDTAPEEAGTESEEVVKYETKSAS